MSLLRAENRVYEGAEPLQGNESQREYYSPLQDVSGRSLQEFAYLRLRKNWRRNGGRYKRISKLQNVETKLCWENSWILRYACVLIEVPLLRRRCIYWRTSACKLQQKDISLAVIALYLWNGGYSCINLITYPQCLNFIFNQNVTSAFFYPAIISPSTGIP